MQRPECRGMPFFTLLWFGELVSIIGSGMTDFAIGVALYQQTESVTYFALIALSMFLPSVVLLPLAGNLADRMDRRVLLILGNFGAALGTLALFFIASGDTLVPWHIYPIVAFKAAMNAVLWPTFSASISLILDRRHFGRANGMTQMAGAFGQILAPLLGGALLIPIGLTGVILIDIATFFVAVTTLLSVRFPQPEPGSGPRIVRLRPGDAPPPGAKVVAGPGGAAPQAAAPQAGAAPGAPPASGPAGPGESGWRFIRERPGLLWLLVLYAAANFCLGFIQVLVVPMVLSFTSPQVLGGVLALAGCGGLVGGILMSVWGGPRAGRRIPLILAIFFGQGAGLFLGGLTPNAALVGTAAFLFMVSLPLVTGTNQALWQLKVPAEIQGRVFATRRMLAWSSLPLSLALAGPLTDWYFEPWMAHGGLLADSFGRLVGVGPGRGIGLLLCLAGLGLICISAAAGRSRSLRTLEEDLPDMAEGEEVAAPRRDPAAERLAGLGFAPAAALAVFLLAATVGAILAQRPSERILDDPALAGFSLQKARDTIDRLAAAPRPTGSPELAEARDFLVEELRGAGLEVEVQRATGITPRRGLIAVGEVENVVARLAGTGGGEASTILLSAHYDSVATSRGAADNAAGVAVLLEAARVLAEGSPPRNDILFLFPDAEEIGLLGAQAFVREHPWAKDVALAINLEARGHGGPVYMFQTGPKTGGWIPPFLDAVPWPTTSSLMDQVYRRLANDTDFTVYAEAGYPGFNLAFIEGFDHYHTEADVPEAVESESLAHHASYALAMARRFADLDLTSDALAVDGERSFFNVIGPWTVSYPSWMAYLLLGAATLLVAWMVWTGLRRGRLSGPGMLQGFLVFFAMLVAIPALTTLIWWVLRDVANLGGTTGAALFMIGFAVLAAAGFTALWGFFRPMITVFDGAAGALLWWWLLAVLASGLALPVEVGFLFVWPLLAAAAGLGWLLGSGDTARPWTIVLVLALAALPGILLLAPLTSGVYTAMQGVFGLGGVSLVLEVLGLGLLLPYLAILVGRRSTVSAIALGLVGLVFLVAGAIEGRQGEHQDSILYAVDADRGETLWFSLDPEPDAWQRSLGLAPGVRAPFARFHPWIGPELLSASAPATEIEAPRIEVLESEIRGVRRTVRLRLHGVATGRALWFDPGARVSAVEIAGRRIPLGAWAPASGTVVIERRTAPPESEEIVLEIVGMEPVDMHVVDVVEGLPEGTSPRPAGVEARWYPALIRSDTTLVRKVFSVP